MVADELQVSMDVKAILGLLAEPNGPLSLGVPFGEYLLVFALALSNRVDCSELIRLVQEHNDPLAVRSGLIDAFDFTYLL